MYIGNTGNVLGLLELHNPVKKKYSEGVSGTEILSIFNVIDKSSNLMTLKDRPEAARLTSIEDQGDEDHALSFESDEHEDELAEEVAWDFNDWQNSEHPGTPA